MWYDLCVDELFLLFRTGNNHRYILTRRGTGRLNQTMPRNAKFDHASLGDFAANVTSPGMVCQSQVLSRMLKEVVNTWVHGYRQVSHKNY